MSKLNIATLNVTIMLLLFSMSIWDNGQVYSQLATNFKWFSLLLLPFSLYFTQGFRVSKKAIISVILVFLFLSSILFSTIKSEYLNVKGLVNVLLYFFVFFIAFSTTISSTNNVQENLFKSMYITATIVLLFSLLFMFSPLSWGGIRFNGVYHNANGLGSIMLLSAIMNYILFKNYENRIYLVALILSMLFMLMTQSRAAILVSVIMFGFVFWHFKEYLKITILLFLGVMFFLMKSILLYIVSSQFLIRDFQISLDPARQEIFERHLSLFLSSPIFGVGLSESESGGRFPAELAYTDILSFSGLVGTFLFMAVIFFTMFNAYIRLNKGSLYLFGNLCVFISVVLLSTGDGYISNIGNPLPLFCFLFIGYVYHE